ISNLFYHPYQAQLAAELTKLSGLDRAFFCNSGTEAWEGALKIARAYAHEKKNNKFRFLALEHSFHGRTFGSVATTHTAKYREPFEPLMPGVKFVKFNDVEDLKAQFDDTVCAVCLEPVQGEGGIHPVSMEFMKAARELCTKNDALLLADEIQCGLGRTGKWFAFQHFGIKPDVVTMAKPIANGLPLGAVLVSEKVATVIHPGMHGTTFGGGPLACATALAVLDAMKKEKILGHVKDTGNYFLKLLHRLDSRHPSIQDVRGVGLMVGVELDSADLAKEVVKKLLAKGIIINRTHETTLRFLPPYIVTKRQVEQVVEALDEALSSSASAGDANQALAGGSKKAAKAAHK
ncbi:MAG TPA: aminotransferase class III-fold pyridoxal phosphate-dependent enzyme, partial [Terriglobales bacterium]